jgi:signal transduction histidine kinase
MHKTAVDMLSSANVTAITEINEDELPALNIIAQKDCWLIFKEAINNVCKYSKASSCTVRIQQVNGSLEMCIADDGIGFSEPASGNGLVNMVTRAKELGGECLIEGSKGNGTMVRVSLPLHQLTTEN